MFWYRSCSSPWAIPAFKMWKLSNELPLCNIGGAAGKGQTDTHNQPSALPGHCDGYLPTPHEEWVIRHGKSYTENHNT